MKADWWETMSDEELEPPMSEEQLKVMDAFTGKGGMPPQFVAAMAGSGKLKILPMFMREKIKRLMEEQKED